MTIDYSQFEDYSWMEGRLQEIDDSLVTYDPNVDPFLNAQWYGVYRIRALPVLNPRDLLRPVGVHWNVIPGADGKTSFFGCPKFTYGKYCPICDAIDAAVGSRRAKREDFQGKDGKESILVQKAFLLRVLLIDFEAGDGNKKKTPKFKDLPQMKIMAIKPSIASDIRSKLEDKKDFGPGKILHPQTGCILRLEKGEKIQNYWKMDVVSNYVIPEEFLDSSQWLPFEDFLPTTTGDDIIELINQNKRGVMPIIANHVLSIPAANTAIPILPEKKHSKEDLKAKLDNI